MMERNKVKGQVDPMPTPEIETEPSIETPCVTDNEILKDLALFIQPTKDTQIVMIPIDFELSEFLKDEEKYNVNNLFPNLHEN